MFNVGSIRAQSGTFSGVDNRMHQIEFMEEANITFVGGVAGPKRTDKTNMAVLGRTSGGGSLKAEVVHSSRRGSYN